jgi:ceramide glucosyltransferase
LQAGTAIRDTLLLLALAPFGYYLAALYAAHRFFRGSPSASPDFHPPISILKPIRGLDRETYANFASFCRQDYPEFEILFCAGDSSEPAIPVIQQIIQDFPERPIRLLIGSEPLGVNDKVNKLCRMVREAKHGFILVSDSDVCVEKGFLKEVAGAFRDPKVGGVTCLYRGNTDGSLGSNLEALGNSTDFAPSVLVARQLRSLDFMLGAVMATTKQQLASIGGFEALVNYLADDYELGNRISLGGCWVELSRFVVSIVYPQQTLWDAFRHQLRWNLAIRCSQPAGHFGLIFSQGLPWTLLAVTIAPNRAIAVAYVVTYCGLRSALAWFVAFLGMNDALAKKFWLLPVRDAFAFVVWLASFFPQRIHWRGQEFYVRKKQLVPAAPRDP